MHSPALELGDVPVSAEGQFCRSCFKRTFCLGTEEENEQILLGIAAVVVATTDAEEAAEGSNINWDANNGLWLEGA